jgi:REP element-mobilizing transposase RayT
MVKRLKGRSSRKLQQEFPSLKQKYWGRHFWGIGYGCWSTGNITDETSMARILPPKDNDFNVTSYYHEKTTGRI